MKLSDRFAMLNRLQKAQRFKIVASILILIAAIVAGTTYTIAVTAPSQSTGAQVQSRADDQSAQPEAARSAQVADNALQSGRLIVDDILAARADPMGVAVGIAIVTALGLVVIWLGLGLTYLGLGLIVVATVVPMYQFESTQGFARLLAGVVVLTASFVALIEGLRFLLSGSGATLAIARNVLVEAVRMKVSIVFIVLLILGLAALPGSLDPGSPLRYRVQSFLQFGTGGAFWVIALMTLFFSASSVTGEQRDKVIWQTVTKPVAAWQYVLGKWLGVVALNAALLFVATSGVFLFTEYLRAQPAVGEKEAFVAEAGRTISNDRLILETQVLSARRATEPELVELDQERFEAAVEARITEQKQRTNEAYNPTPGERAKVAMEIFTSVQQAYRSVEPGRDKRYYFQGLSRARDLDLPITLTYRIDAGSNRPDEIYKLTFQVSGTPMFVREAGLGPNHTITLAPMLVAPDGTVVLMDDSRFEILARAGTQAGVTLIRASDMIDDNGRLTLMVGNGEPMVSADRKQFALRANAETITFPPGGMRISFAAGSYRANYMRVIGVLWLKLAFLAMLAITAGTFLGFPTACLVAFGIFFMAEGANYLGDSLNYYIDIGPNTKLEVHEHIIKAIGLTVSQAFKTYADLKPTKELVDGRLMTLGDVANGLAVLTFWTAGLFALAVGIFRKRELAIYSGH